MVEAFNKNGAQVTKNVKQLGAGGEIKREKNKEYMRKTMTRDLKEVRHDKRKARVGRGQRNVDKDDRAKKPLDPIS